MIHQPALLKEVIEYLSPKPGDTILDATIDGGGHARLILEKILPDGKLIGIDQDGEILKNLRIKNQELRIKNNIPARHYQPVHNVFLLIWAEIGIIGLLFFIGLLLCVINKKGSKNLIVSMPLLAAMIMIFLFDHWWWSLHFGVLFFWLVLGIAEIKHCFISATDNDNKIIR